MAATPTTTTDAAGLHTPSKPAACLVVDTIDSGCSDYVEGVDVQFWQPSAGVSVPLDENGKPAFYQECSDAIRYSTSMMTTLIQAYTQPFYHATYPQFAPCFSQVTALNPSPPDADVNAHPSTFSYSGDRASARSKMPGLDVAHERELFYITSSIIQITKGSAVTLRLAENYLNRITPLITQLRAHKMSEEAGHLDCCWTLASLASPNASASASASSESPPLCPLPSCETSHPALFRQEGSQLNPVGDENELPHPSTITLPLRLDSDGHLSQDTFTQPCHTLPDPSTLNILLERPVMTMTAALLLAAKTVNESGFWLRRIAHTTVQDISELRACERALLQALQWHTTYVPVTGVDSPALTKTLAVSTAPAADLAPVLGVAPTYYQCIPWMLWQYIAHEPDVHAAIAATFMRPCSYVSREAQQELFEHLAWLSRTVPGVLIGDRDWAHAQTVERRRLDLLVGVLQQKREREPLVAAAVSSSPGARRLSPAARRRETRMLKHAHRRYSTSLEPHVVRKMDSDEDSDNPPPTHIRWFHAGHGLAHLDLLATPIPVLPRAASAPITSWTAFTREESDCCEAAWHALSDEQRANALAGDPGLPVAAPVINDDDEEELILGIPIGKERLFEVDPRTLRMYCVYWKITGPPIPVLRGVWMYDQNRPVGSILSQELETAYLAIKPWKSSYEDELRTAAEIGASAYEKLRYPLPSSDASVFFDDASQARIISSSLGSRFSSVVLSAFQFRSVSTSIGTGTGPSPYPSAPVVYRGYDAALQRPLPLPRRPGTPGAAASTISASTPSSPASRPSELLGPATATATPTPTRKPAQEHKFRPQSLDGKLVDLKKHMQKRANGNRSNLTVPFVGPEEGTIERQLLAEAEDEQHDRLGSKVGEGPSQDVTDLILIIHGIGQGLTAQYESFNFVYATNLFRQAARKQALSPALASIMRSHNVQFLPVQWKTTLRLDEDEARKRKMDGLDNSFSLADITLKKHIPVVRELTNEVLIDIPYFMSHHQSSMIESVCAQANRLYRLWCARNPDFSKNGRVHILAHSLGSALAAHILSNQPTAQPPLEDFTLEEIKQKSKSQFLFNTSSLFMIGSPLGVFLHLNQAQLIGRKGRERTMHSPDDEALDRVGLLGCLSIDSLYNVFHPSDPVAYKLNAAVDAKRAKDLPVYTIPTINESIFSTFSKGVSKIFNFGQPANQQPTAAAGGDEDTPFELELGGGPEKLQGDRAERRFMALNRHGCIDFFLTAEGSISEYVDMITAHSGYWGDGSLAAFILAEIFARKEDLVRTGLGPSVMPNT